MSARKSSEFKPLPSPPLFSEYIDNVHSNSEIEEENHINSQTLMGQNLHSFTNPNIQNPEQAQMDISENVNISETILGFEQNNELLTFHEADIDHILNKHTITLMGSNNNHKIDFIQPKQKHYSATRIQTKAENKMIVSGFIRSMQNQEIMPSSIIDICCTYSFINLLPIFENNASLWDMFLFAKNECYAFNFLLSKEICEYFIYAQMTQKSTFHSILGKVYSLMRLPQKAENQYKLSIELEPSDVYLWNYSTFLRQASRFKEAAVLLKKAIELSPKDIGYQFEYAKCLELNGDQQYREEYMEVYESITFTLQLQSGSRNKEYQNDAKTHLYKAVCHKILNDMESSESEYQNYLEIINIDELTENVTAFARLLYMLEKYNDAMAMIGKAVERGRPNPSTLYYHAMMLRMNEDYTSAKKAFEKALNLSTNFVKCEVEYKLLLKEHF